jgi:hypothetical protein
MTNNQLLGEIAQSVEQRTENLGLSPAIQHKLLIIKKSKKLRTARECNLGHKWNTNVPLRGLTPEKDTQKYVPQISTFKDKLMS